MKFLYSSLFCLLSFLNSNIYAYVLLINNMTKTDIVYFKYDITNNKKLNEQLIIKTSSVECIEQESKDFFFGISDNLEEECIITKVYKFSDTAISRDSIYYLYEDDNSYIIRNGSMVEIERISKESFLLLESLPFCSKSNNPYNNHNSLNKNYKFFKKNKKLFTTLGIVALGLLFFTKNGDHSKSKNYT